MTAFWQAKTESKDAEKLAKSSNRSHPDVNALRCGPMRYDRHLSQHPDATDCIDTENVPLDGGTAELRDIILWDMAGQPGYRLINQLHLNEVSIALIVFDAKSDIDPFAGVRYWERALRQAQQMTNRAVPLVKYLVAARVDRSGINVGAGRITRLMQKLQFDGYFETSAREGLGIDELSNAIRRAINWQALPKISSETFFHKVQEFIIKMRTEGRLLLTEDDIFGLFQLGNLGLEANPEEFKNKFTVSMQLMEGRGLVRRLSFEKLILFRPELLDSYGSAIVNTAKDEPDGMGSILEEHARSGRFSMSKDERVKNRDLEKSLLIATVEELIHHEVALREQTEDGPVLVFPSQFSRERVDLPEPDGKDVVFTFEGALLNVYATLAVRLSCSGTFSRKSMWKSASTYLARAGGLCGVFFREIKEGKGELGLFYDAGVSVETRYHFEEFVHAHIRRKALPESIKKRSVVRCSRVGCGFTVTDQQIGLFKSLGLQKIDCPACKNLICLGERESDGYQFPVNELDMESTADEAREFSMWVVSATAETRATQFAHWARTRELNLAIVFTDVVGSTASNYQKGSEAWNQIRRSHFEQIQHLVEKYDGCPIKPIEDSTAVGFRTASAALRFALELNNDPGNTTLQVRSGIHFGRVSTERGETFGEMVNFAAAMVGLATGAQIWLSEEAYDDLNTSGWDNSDASRINCEVHPCCKLNGFPRVYNLWAVEHQRGITGALNSGGPEKSNSLLQKISRGDFDVFLCYNTGDRSAVRRIGEALKREGILPWFDEWELRPGLPWQFSLERQIPKIRSAAVFVGQSGIGPYQGQEAYAFLREFVRRQCPVIPVLLPEAPSAPPLPIMLEGMHWVDYRKNDPEPFRQLVWGITGVR